MFVCVLLADTTIVIWKVAFCCLNAQAAEILRFVKMFMHLY